jgi:hypothetical protein
MSGESSTEREQQINRLIADVLEAERNGQGPDSAELLRQHPEFAAELKSFFADRGQFRSPFPWMLAAVIVIGLRGHLPPLRTLAWRLVILGVLGFGLFMVAWLSFLLLRAAAGRREGASTNLPAAAGLVAAIVLCGMLLAYRWRRQHAGRRRGQ